MPSSLLWRVADNCRYRFCLARHPWWAYADARISFLLRKTYGPIDKNRADETHL